MRIPKKCDVVVIGGGPGGSTISALLKDKGYDVVLLEKVKHPRFTVGESLIPHFWKYCEYTGVDKKIDEEGFIQKAGGTVVWNGVIRQMQFKDFGYTRPALHVERDRFDHILLEHAKEKGVQVFEEVTAIRANLNDGHQSSVVYRPNGEKTQGEISCKFVVDASGQNAVIAKQLGVRELDEGFRFMSIWGYFKNSRYVASDGRAHPFEELRKIPPTTFVSNVDDWGWLWHIPQRESTSVGLILPRQQMQAIKDSDEALERYFLRRCKEIPYLNQLLEPASYCEGSFHVIRDYSYVPTQLTGPGFFLIGDAAAFIDPIFSIGVVLAMYSAYVAAWAIDRSFKNPSRTEQNQAIFARQYRGRLEASRALALPRYGYSGEHGEMVQTSIQFETSLEQELMYVVSTLTTRSQNFEEMSRSQKQRITSSNKYRQLEEIVF
ncbi:MAG: NAD(P)/FAD-dependent oxidoreductase [Calditrichaeota bacterium]|nr:MAG: NAD(P)/FAD-dependent oxidoreductase [Calditrichota bacterium]